VGTGGETSNRGPRARFRGSPNAIGNAIGAPKVYSRLFVRPWRPDTGLSNAPHIVWGRVVADTPAFNRELVAALAEG
jgi:hypothetical protein